MKRKLNVKKKAFLTEQVSSIMNTPNKLKDPGSPIIPVTIGTKTNRECSTRFRE